MVYRNDQKLYISENNQPGVPNENRNPRGGRVQLPMQNRGQGSKPVQHANRHQYREEFRRLDTNNDGVLSYDEHGPKPVPADEYALFREVDSNRDLYIDFAEYTAAKKHGLLGGNDPDAPYPNPSRREFNLADTKKTGKIDFREFTAARKNGLLGGHDKKNEVIYADPLDSNPWSVIGLLLVAIMFFLLGTELDKNNPNESLCREYGYVAAIGFCFYLIGMLLSTRGGWCATPVLERGFKYFAKLLVLCGSVTLATVMWGLALGFTMNDGERLLVETCSYILAISCVFIGIGRVLHTREKSCPQVTAWFAFAIMFLIGLFFLLFGHFYGVGEREDGTYSMFSHIIGALFLIYIVVLIVDMVTLGVFF